MKRLLLAALLIFSATNAYSQSVAEQMAAKNKKEASSQVNPLKVPEAVFKQRFNESASDLGSSYRIDNFEITSANEKRVTAKVNFDDFFSLSATFSPDGELINDLSPVFFFPADENKYLDVLAAFIISVTSTYGYDFDDVVKAATPMLTKLAKNIDKSVEETIMDNFDYKDVAVDCGIINKLIMCVIGKKTH